MGKSGQAYPRLFLAVCVAVIAAYWLMIDLKGISTDEGLRLAISNGGEPFTLAEPASHASWSQVMAANSPQAYQPLYYLILNTLMRVARTHDVVFLRLLNLVLLWVCLQGLLTLSQAWRLVPRLFLFGLFAFNAYLFMHVMQIREYTAGLAFYIWSTWLVLRLDQHELRRNWSDWAWFGAYGLLLSVGFYLQSWVVFPVIGQVLFLTFRRRNDRGYFRALLIFAGALVLVLTLPYLVGHQQKMDVGRWGQEHAAVLPQLSMGFHLVLTGHQPGQFRFTDFLFWFWLATIAGTLLLLAAGKFRAGAAAARTDLQRQGLLMALCVAVSLAFQVGYALTRDDLSLWPRYFVVHYFFLTWLIALGFRYASDLGSDPAVPSWSRRGLTAVTGTVFALMVASGIFQTRSYYRDPYLDTGLNPGYSWQTLCAELSNSARTNDAIVLHDFVVRSAMTFSRPFSHRVLLLPELEKEDLHAFEHVAYLEFFLFKPERAELARRLAALGFGDMKEVEVRSADRKAVLADYRILVFSRH